MNTNIQLKSREYFLSKGVYVPPSLWREPSFKFQPLPFGTNSDSLHEKIYESNVQKSSLSHFLKSPEDPLIYGVGSAPSDTKAKIFAAYLVQNFLEKAEEGSNVHWIGMDNSLRNPTINGFPSLIVITGLSPVSSNLKLDKTRDLLDAYPNSARIVVVAGEDPITYFSTRLFYDINGVFFHCAQSVKRKVEVV